MIYQKNVFVSCLAAIFVFGSLTSGQNYHYSNGWLPGKRSSSESCQFRPEFPNLLFKFIEITPSKTFKETWFQKFSIFLILLTGLLVLMLQTPKKDEVSRMLVDPTCINGMAPLKNLLQLKKEMSYQPLVDERA